MGEFCFQRLSFCTIQLSLLGTCALLTTWYISCVPRLHWPQLMFKVSAVFTVATSIVKSGSLFEIKIVTGSDESRQLRYTLQGLTYQLAACELKTVLLGGQNSQAQRLLSLVLFSEQNQNGVCAIVLEMVEGILFFFLG